MEQKNIMKYCKCGCGQEIIDNNYTNKQFVNFHQNRGRKFPVKFGNHVCWYFPILHPSYVLKKQSKWGNEIQFWPRKRRGVRCVNKMYSQAFTESGRERNGDCSNSFPLQPKRSHRRHPRRIYYKMALEVSG